MRFAVSQSASHTKKPYDFIRHAYIAYCATLGIEPVVVPNVLADPAAYATALGVEGVLLTGGGDIAPGRYGQPNAGSKSISPARDRTEYSLLHMAVARSLPVLGICRGIQVINVFLGGGLVQDIPAEIGRAVNHEDGQHPVALVHPAVSDLLGADRIAVNSYHHQGLDARTLAPDLAAFAISEEDGIIEGVLHIALPILGVQWHPEKPGPSEDADLRLFGRFLQGMFWEGS